MSSDDRELELAELDAMLQNENGRKVLSRVLEHSGFFVDTFNSDSHIHANRAGARGEGVWLYNELLEASPLLLNKLIEERNDGR